MIHKQRLFENSLAELIYFSPYVDISLLGSTKMLIKRYDTGEQIVLSCSVEDALNQLITCLSHGISRDKLAEYMGSDVFFEICNSKGVIE